MASAPALKVGTGLTEVSAIATVIGASNAQALTLGMKGAAGTAWASMSSFGALHVAKAAIAGAVPDWSRESLGLDGAHVDNAIGVVVEVDTKKALSKKRWDMRDVQALKITFGPHILAQRARPLIQPDNLEKGTPAMMVDGPIDERVRLGSMYVLDRGAALVLDMIPATPPKESLEIHEFIPDVDAPSTRGSDWLTTLGSAVKLGEVVALKQLGSHSLWWVTAMPWLCSFLGAIALHTAGIGRDDPNVSQSDIIFGTLPSPMSPGREKKVMIGIPANSRRHFGWLVVWSILPAVVLVSVVNSFILLSTQPPRVVYVWAGFQTLWLLARSGIYYKVEGATSAPQGVIRTTTWEETDLSIRRRVICLLFGVSMQQVTIHPRGVIAYRHDEMSGRAIAGMFGSTSWKTTDHIPMGSLARCPVQVNVVKITGDNVLRTFAWARGVAVDHSDVYDAALVFVQIQGILYAVPSARVRTCGCVGHAGRRYRGTTHGATCPLAKWVTWLPVKGAIADEQVYLQLDYGQSLGPMTGIMQRAAELHQSLESRKWSISFTKVSEVEAVLRTSRIVAVTLRDSLQDVYGPNPNPSS